MTLLLIICGIAIAFVFALVRALAMDEVRGRIQRRVETSVEATISSLPPELQEEWGDEWRAELGAMKSMPLSAIAFARGLRQTALQLAGASELAPARAGSSREGGWFRRGGFDRMASSLSNSKILAFLKKRWEALVALIAAVTVAWIQVLLPLTELLTLVLSVAVGLVIGIVLIRERK